MSRPSKPSVFLPCFLATGYVVLVIAVALCGLFLDGGFDFLMRTVATLAGLGWGWVAGFYLGRYSVRPRS